MTTYVVMAPPEFENLAGDPADTDRLTFVPDRFSALAFLFSFFWLLAHRMWLVLLAYLAIVLAVELLALAVNPDIMGVVAFFAALLFAIEAQALRRWSLERKGWRVLGLVEGRDLEEAELSFLHKEAAQLEQPLQSVAPAQPTTTPIVPRVGSEQVIGLTLGPETRQ